MKTMKIILVILVFATGCATAQISTDEVIKKIDEQTVELKQDISNVSYSTETLSLILGNIIVMHDKIDYIMECFYSDTWDKPDNMMSIYDMYNSTYGIVVSTN